MRIEYKCPYDVSPSNKTELLKLSTFFNVWTFYSFVLKGEIQIAFLAKYHCVLFAG
jgi:hypothetical protein